MSSEPKQNTCLGEGMYDRTGVPNCLCRTNVAVMHYEGSIGLFLLASILPIWSMCCWTPTVEQPGDVPNEEENGFCAKGMLDRRRNPACLTKLCCGPIAVCHYEGWPSAPCIIGTVFAPYTWFCWKPTLKAKAMLVGAPVYGAF